MSSRIARRSAASSGEMATCLLISVFSGLEDGAGFEKRLEPVPAIFSAYAGVFESTPGRLWIVRHAVDHDAARPQLRGHAARTAKVGPDDGGVKTIFGVVGDRYRFVLGLVGDDTENGAENLFPGDRHVVLDIDEHRGLHEMTRFETFGTALAPDQQLSAFFNALADVGLRALVLLLRHHGSDRGLGIGRVADGEGAHGVRDGALSSLESVPRHKKSGPCSAGLTAVQKRDAQRRRDHLVEVAVIEKDCGRLATQLERHALHRRGAIAHDGFAHGNRARERDLVYARISYKLGPNDIAEARDDVEEALRQIGLVESLDQHPRLQRA